VRQTGGKLLCASCDEKGVNLPLHSTARVSRSVDTHEHVICRLPACDMMALSATVDCCGKWMLRFEQIAAQYAEELMSSSEHSGVVSRQRCVHVLSRQLLLIAGAFAAVSLRGQIDRTHSIPI